MAAVIVLEAIFEADLTDEQYAYRQKRSAHQAVREVHRLLNRGYTEVVDADLSSYFDTISHHERMQSVARRVSDRPCWQWSNRAWKGPVEEDDGKGNKRRTAVNKDSGRGKRYSARAPISPLLDRRSGSSDLRVAQQPGTYTYADHSRFQCRTALVAKKRIHGRRGTIRDSYNAPIAENVPVNTVLADASHWDAMAPISPPESTGL